MSMSTRYQDVPEAHRHTEGPVALAIEEQTAKIPSDIFLWAAVGSGAISLMFEMTGNHHKSHFVGQWVAPFMLLGIYNKIVKTSGSDRIHRSSM